ncbi:hypothetical protein LTR53_007663 [Teratosphaeriaceae sp. CCFEE 6253]|nr:hypothetical protein LTR53_007663 [Teratosphaeriaceae sp. CCFEE 6253]
MATTQAIKSSSCKEKGKDKVTETALEFYDVKQCDTYGVDDDTATGFFANVRFDGCVLVETRFEDCVFVNVTFEKCTFSDTIFAGLYLKDVTFTGCTFDGHKWMSDELEGAFIAKHDLSNFFPFPVKLGSGIPRHATNVEWLEMQRSLALNDGSHKELDEAFARRLQLEEDEKWPSSEHGTTNSQADHSIDDGKTRGKKARKVWIDHWNADPFRNAADRGPAVGENAHTGSNAGLVLGFDRHGFPIVEHPSFPSVHLPEDMTSQPPSTQSAPIHAEPSTVSEEHDISSASPTGVGEERRRETLVPSTPSKATASDPPPASSAAAHGGSSTATRENGTPNARHEKTSSSSFSTKSKNGVPHFQLDFVQRREQEAAEAAGGASFSDLDAVHRQAPSAGNNFSSGSESAASINAVVEEDHQHRLLDLEEFQRNRARECLTLFVSAPKDGKNCGAAQTKSADAENASPIVATNGASGSGSIVNGKSVDKYGFPVINHPFFDPVEVEEGHALDKLTTTEHPKKYELNLHWWHKAKDAGSDPKPADQPRQHQSDTTQRNQVPAEATSAPIGISGLRAITKERGWKPIQEDEDPDSE